MRCTLIEDVSFSTPDLGGVSLPIVLYEFINDPREPHLSPSATILTRPIDDLLTIKYSEPVPPYERSLISA